MSEHLSEQATMLATPSDVLGARLPIDAPTMAEPTPPAKPVTDSPIMPVAKTSSVDLAAKVATTLTRADSPYPPNLLATVTETPTATALREERS